MKVSDRIVSLPATAAPSEPEEIPDAELVEMMQDEVIAQAAPTIELEDAPEAVREAASEIFARANPSKEWNETLMVISKGDEVVGYVAIVFYEDGFGHAEGLRPDGRPVDGEIVIEA